MVVLLIGLTTALGCVALGLGLFVLRASGPVTPTNADRVRHHIALSNVASPCTVGVQGWIFSLTDTGALL
jgi:hypothetical protein